MNAHIVIGLQAIYVVLARLVLKVLWSGWYCTVTIKVKDLSSSIDVAVNKLLNMEVEGDLRRKVTMNIKRLIDMAAIALCHCCGLPCRGRAYTH